MRLAHPRLCFHAVIVLLLPLRSTAVPSSVDYQVQSNGAICSSDYFGALAFQDCQSALWQIQRGPIGVSNLQWFRSIWDTLDLNITKTEGVVNGVLNQLPYDKTFGTPTFAFPQRFNACDILCCTDSTHY